MKSTTNQRKEHVGHNSVAILSRLAVVASQICEIQQNSTKIRTITVQGHPRSEGHWSWCQSKAHDYATSD